MPSYAPPKQPRHKGLSQHVPRPKNLNLDWKVRAADALPKLLAARATVQPAHPDYVHWSEAIGHMHRLLDDHITTNTEAKHTFLLAQRAANRALSLAALG